jgi:hypothetical protein
MSHVVPSHVAADAPVGTEHGAHAVGPHEFTLVLDAQFPVHACDPVGQTPEQAAFTSMQAPRQAFCPVGQVTPQLPIAQVAVPPVGATHGLQDVPQLLGLVSLAQTPPHA